MGGLPHLYWGMQMRVRGERLRKGAILLGCVAMLALAGWLAGCGGSGGGQAATDLSFSERLGEALEIRSAVCATPLGLEREVRSPSTPTRTAWPHLPPSKCRQRL